MKQALEPSEAPATHGREWFGPPRPWVACLALGLVLGLAGCTTGASGPDSPNGAGTSSGQPTDGSTTIQVTGDPGGITAAMRTRGASPEQIAVVENGDVTFEDYQAAVGKTIACLRGAGIDVINDAVTTAPGYPVIPYSFGASSTGRTDDQTLAIADECIYTNSFFVEGAYARSTAVLEVKDARFAQYRDALVSCIRSHDGQVDDDADMRLVSIAATDVQIATGVDCLATTGYQR